MKVEKEKRFGMMYKTLLTLSIVASSATAWADGELVGSDGGSISVGNSGQAAWSMPLEVPSGINGVAPNLNLSLSTSGGNGSLGVGGGLSGLSVISRCGRTIHQDGYFQAPQFEQSDAYCLDGARLVLENGDYGAGESIYRTEIESFQRIQAFGSIAGKGPEYFEVTNRNGAKMFFGQRSSTRDIDSASGAVAVWKIDQLIDSNTNTLHYHYEDVSGNNEVQLKSITYGGNTNAALDEHLSIELEYEDRPDTSTTWSRGQQFSQTKRISNIYTKVGETIVKNYVLKYQQGEVSGASRLQSLQLCAGNGDCYRPTKFEYVPESDSDWTASSLALPAPAQSNDGDPLGMLVDINNDGKSDWISAYTSDSGLTTINTWLGSLSGWQQSSEFSLPDVLFDYSQNDDGFAKGLLLDVNGDGWPDYVQAFQTASGQSIQTWRNDGTTFVRDAALDLPAALVSLETDGSVRSLADIADLNADGLVDVVQAVNLNGAPLRVTWMHQFANGSHSWSTSSAYQAPTIAADYTQGTDGRALATMQDVNGDGLADWVQSFAANGATSNATWLNTGQGFETNVSAAFTLPATTALVNYDLHEKGIPEYSFMDVNGDGLPDVVKALDLSQLGGNKTYDAWIHNGLAWVQDTAYNLPDAIVSVAADGNWNISGGLIDLDSDGHPDFAQSWVSEDQTQSNQATYLFDSSSKQWISSEDHQFPFLTHIVRNDFTGFSIADVADINHDGYPELINTLTGDVYETAQSDQYPGTLVRTINPLGGTTELQYGISTDPAIYELAEQSAYPNVAYNAPVRVVTTVTASTGVSDDLNTTDVDERFIAAHHRYGKAKTNLLGQGGLGYATHTMIDGNSGVKIVATFHQTYPYAGRVKGNVKTLDGITFSTSNSEMELLDITINELTTLYPHPNHSVAETRDLNGKLIKITRSSSEIDNFGNATLSTNAIFDANDDLVRTSSKRVKYKAPDFDRWLFGLPERTTQTLIDQATGETYTNVATATFAADGKPTSETLEPNSENSVNNKWVKKTYTYDGFGNRATSTITAADIVSVDAAGKPRERTSTTTLTADGRFPKTVQNALGHTISTVFDPVLGKPLSVTDANDIKKEFVYDGFGTVVKETKTHQDNGAIRGRQIVLPKWCEGNTQINCPDNAVYFIAAFDDQGEAPEIGFYNVNGKELRKQTYGHGGKIIVVETEYDANGKVTQVSQPYFKDEETAHWTQYQYDILGRQIKRTNAENEQFTTTYDYLTVRTENPGNNDSGKQVTEILNNIFGQPIQSKDPQENITQYVYDGRGKLVKTIDAHGNEATITYDPVFGRKIAMDDPDLGAWSYEYNALGNLVAQVDANGLRTEMKYDILNRLENRTDGLEMDGNGVVHAGEKTETTTWEYSNVQQDGDLIGALRKVISPNYERSVKYDQYSRVVEATSTIDHKTFTQKTGYRGTADKVDWIQYPSGLAVRNTYDDYGFPKTVEGLALDHEKYLEYQKASDELIKLQRELELFKNANLTDEQLAELEHHEGEVRRLGKILSDFYKEFEDNADNIAHKDEAERYKEILDRVQEKLTQHTNWYNIYQGEIDTRYDPIRDDIKRLQDIADIIKPYQRTYNDAKALHDNYLGKVLYYAGKLNEHGDVINHHLGIAKNARIHVNNLIDSLYWPNQAVRYKIPENLSMSGIETMFNDLDCCTQFVVDTFMKTQNPALISSHLNDIQAQLGVISTSAGHMAHHQQIIVDKKYQWWYDHWEPRRKGEEAKMVSAANFMKPYGDEAETLDKKVTPHLNRINDWLAPIVKSHSNVLMSFNDRARAYVMEISKRTGSYAKRDDLKSEKFLKPFKNHVEYIRCLRDQSSKTSGACYAEHLVHAYNDDGSIDTDKQTEERDKVDDDTIVDVKKFWNTNRFLCPIYYGYGCPWKYSAEVKQLAKTIHIFQCQRMTDEQKEADGVAPCDTSKWNDTYKNANDEDKPSFPYLVTDVVAISNTLNNYYADLVTRHEEHVETLVTNATKDTYNEETTYEDIIQLGGNLWLASTPEEIDEGDEDPREYVLLYQGEVQILAQNTMDDEQRMAQTTLKGHQYEVAQIVNRTDSEAYNKIYLAVQDKAAEVERLYKEIDEAYANAAEEDEFDEDDFNASKKVYWEANDFNSKGQVLSAAYGNGTNTTWTYDQFGRIVSHFTQDKDGGTLLDNSYQYDAIGNLTQRVDAIEDVTEDFSYDILNRLVQSDLSGLGTARVAQVQGDVVTYKYNEIGNLKFKSDIAGGGDYTYGVPAAGAHAGPHAVTNIGGLNGLGDFTYDQNGNQLTGNGRTVVYSAFNKPTSIIKNGELTKMWYGPERQLIQQQQPTSDGTLETTTFVGGLYEEVAVTESEATTTTQRHHISVAGHIIAVVEKEDGNPLAYKESYLHKNHQSSVLAITDALGAIIERRYYDAFGAIKSGIGGATDAYSSWLNFNTVTTMAFTGHRTLISAGVIHMGGRVYDATIGRFLSADPHIQSPLNSQSLNRYSYTLNNPLSFTDPSGYFFSSILKIFKKLFNMIKKIIKAVLKHIQKVIRAIIKSLTFHWKYIKKYARVIVAVVVAVVAVSVLGPMGAGWATSLFGVKGAAATVIGGALVGGLAGGLSGLIMTGSFKGMLEGAVFGAITAGFAKGLEFTKLGAKAIDFVANGIAKGTKIAKYAKEIIQVMAHGVIGGARAIVNGGKFFAGFVAGAVGKAFTIAGDAFSAIISDNVYIQGLTVALVGGLSSKLVGGSFELGFLTAGLAFAVNHILSVQEYKARFKKAVRESVFGAIERMADGVDDWMDRHKVDFYTKTNEISFGARVKTFAGVGLTF